VHVGAVGGLAAPRVRSPTGGGGMAGGASTPVVWSFGADCSVRAWAMSARLHDRLSRTREAIEGQHAALGMMRSMLPRAAAAAAGRLEAAAQRSDMLARRLLDLEVSVSVGGAVDESHRAGGGERDSAMAAESRRRTTEYKVGMAALNDAHRELATDVEENLLALRGRIDECALRAPHTSNTQAERRARICTAAH
jgi:hypothetical protein